MAKRGQPGMGAALLAPLALVAAVALSSLSPVCGENAWFAESSRGGPRSGGLRVSFPPSFYVTIGTTIPLAEPVTQSGAIYVSNETRQLRIDNFWMGQQRTFLADMKHQVGYVYERDATWAGGRSSCSRFVVQGDLTSFGVPSSFSRDGDPSVVRGAQVTKYSGLVKDSAGPVQEVDYFVRQLPCTVESERVGSTDGDKADGSRVCSVPYRVQTRRRLGSRAPKEIAGAPVSVPNWRYFGAPMFDELVAKDAEPFDMSLEHLFDDITVTVDFFNFVPEQPDLNIFAIPKECLEEETTSSEAFFEQDVDVSLAQRLLVDLSFFTAHGKKAMVNAKAAAAAGTAIDG